MHFTTLNWYPKTCELSNANSAPHRRKTRDVGWHDTRPSECHRTKRIAWLRDCGPFEPYSSGSPYSRVRRSSCALNATIMLADIRTAVKAGVSNIAFDASTPAASGLANTL
jgi:hypothetical protein